MAFMDLHFYSESLGMQTSVYVIIPQEKVMGEIGVEHGNEHSGEVGKYKCLYLLHHYILLNTQHSDRRKQSVQADNPQKCLVDLY